MVFQNYALYPHMSVYENMAFGLKLRRTPRQEIETRVHEAARILGLTGLLDRKPKALSGGQRQRVALGRAIVRRPQVFLMDEPLSNLDAKLRVQMRAEINRLHKQLNSTVIYVTHDQVEAMTMGDRIAVLSEGIVQQCDSPQALYDRPANKFVAGFIGSPAMNFLPGTLSRGAVVGEGFKLDLPRERTKGLVSYDGVEVELGVRPEHIYPANASPAKRDEAGEFEAQVDVVEPLGAEAYVYLRLGPHALVSRIPPSLELHYGETARFVFDRERLHLFNKSTTEAIRS
jgi:multiple sugar transport system ATP-binding protein